MVVIAGDCQSQWYIESSPVDNPPLGLISVSVSQVSSLEQTQDVMAALRDVRDRESSIEMELLPILDAYTLLTRYLPPEALTDEEMRLKSSLRQKWTELSDLAEEVANK